MNQGKARGDYASAYKLSGANVDKKAQRRLRRSIEQKEFRQNRLNSKRNLVDLSPLQEGDASYNKHYKDKTPVKTKASGKPSKDVDRLEQLKKWKEERERKRRAEENSHKPTFRVSKALDRKSETKLFEASKLKRHPVKPLPVPVTKPVPIVTKPAIQKPTRSQPPVTKTRQLSGHSATTKGPKNASSTATRPAKAPKEKEIPAKPASTRVLRTSTRNATIESTRTTRQTASKVTDVKQPKPKAKPTKEPTAVVEPEPALMTPAANHSFITQRGDTTFAPADFTFDMSSFVFRPLSPNSAANFLTGAPNQNNSCSSFMESNPNRSSTPKRRKQEPAVKIDTTVVEEPVVKIDTTVAEESVVKIDTTVAEESVVKNNATVVEQSTVELDQETTSTDNTVLTNKDETVTNTPVNESMNLRRSTRRRSTMSTASETAAQDVTIPTEKPKATPKATPRRRSLRVSLLSASTAPENADSSTPSEDNQNVRRSGRRRSVAVSSSDSDPSEPEVNSPAKRRSSRRSVPSTSSLVEEIKEVAISGTLGTPSSTPRGTRRSRRSVAPAKEPEVEPIPETDESSQDSDEVFEGEKDSNNVSDIDHNKENDKPIETIDSTKKLRFDALPNKQPSGQKKTPKQKTRKSFGGFRLPSADSVVLSGKRSRRKTMMPKSPEEWVEVLNNSPMVEMSRRKPKLGNQSLPALSFELDLDEIEPTIENEENKRAEREMAMDTIPVLNLNTELEKEENPMEETTQSTVEDNKQEEVIDNVDNVTPSAAEVIADVENKENVEVNQSDVNPVHDVPYFRNLLRTETDRLNEMCDQWTEINKNIQVNEEVCGQIRATVGKAQLLVAQRFKQFLGLVDDCEFKRGEKETTCTDLDGFWEMVYFQVEDCDNKFAELKKLQDNNWVDTSKPVVKKVVKKKVKPAVSKPAVKSKFAAFRAQMKKQKDLVNSPGAVPVVEEKVFEAPGFFTVSSPVKSPMPHCAAGTPSKATPSSTTKDNSAKKQDTLSVPLSSAELAVSTPPRRSYLPAVPSPLLQDTTPLPRPARGCTKKTPIPKRIVDEMEGSQDSSSKRQKTTPARRSLRSRQSVDFIAIVPESPKPDDGEDEFDKLVKPVDTTSMETNDDFCDVSNESFSKYLQPSIIDTSEEKVETPRQTGRRRSCLKGCKSTERRRSRLRSVQFSSPKSTTSSITMPHTPYNRDSLVEKKRVTRSTPSDNYDIFDFDNDDNDENVPPPSHRDSRVSLLGTPPGIIRKVIPTVEVPTATLISFTP